MISKEEIAIWGTPPPPIGGMSVHIERLTQYLEREGISYCMYDLKSLGHAHPNIVNIKSIWRWYLSLIFLRSPKIHYVISSTYYVRFLAVILKVVRRKKVIIRVGGESLAHSLQHGGLQKHMSLWATKNCTAFIGVNAEIYKLARDIRNNNKITAHIPGFILPIDNKEIINEDIKNFLNSKSCNMAYSGMIQPKSDRDIYGAWLLLEALSQLKKSTDDFRIVIYTYVQYLDDGYKEFLEEIIKLKLEDNILVKESTGPLHPVFNHIDLFLRPSLTDGDSNALREALAFKVPSIASDAVPRPNGCTLFDNGNISDLSEKLLYAIRNIVTLKASAQHNTIENNAPILLSLIETVRKC